MLNQELHYLLMVVYNLSNRAITSRIAGTGLLPGQPKILEYLMEHDGCTQKEIGEGCGLDKSTIAVLLPKLDKAGLIRREPCVTDRRFCHVYLTEEGKEMGAQVHQICASWDEQVWGSLPPSERQAFLDTLKALIRQMKELSPPRST